MRLLDEHNLADYLREVALLGPHEAAAVRALSGGVSNVVFYVEHSADAKAANHADFVLKQARGQLRVAQPWFCSVERIWREAEVLRVCDSLLARRASEGGGRAVNPRHGFPTIPRVLFEDRPNFAFAMTAAPPGHRTWKTDLLARQMDPAIAAACGHLLATLHGGSWNDAALASSLGDRSFFIDLRVDPYYRRIAEVHPELRPAINDLIVSLENHPRSLVHGDFSPKNLLVWDGGLMLVDCEVGHFGDPAFDLGFLLTHLLLKGVLQRPDFRPAIGLCEAFLAAYAQGLAPAVSRDDFRALQRRGVQNLAGCLLARVDGKSPVEYLTSDEQRNLVRSLAARLFTEKPPTLAAAVQVGATSLMRGS